MLHQIHTWCERLVTLAPGHPLAAPGQLWYTLRVLADLLRPYRKHEQLLGLTVVTGDLTALRVLAAWLTWPTPPWRRARRKQPADERLLWDWIWEPVWNAIDFGDFGLAAGLAPGDAERALRTCLSARLVYPDGEISEGAKALLQAHIQRELPSRPHRGKGKK